MREAKLTEPQIQVRMDRDLRAALDDHRRNEPDLPTRPEAIRRLMRQALAALTAQKITGPSDA